MRALRATTGLLTAVMAVTIAYGFAAGSFSDEGGTILINTDRTPESYTNLTPRFTVATVNASDIAVRHRLGTRSQPIVNTAIIGASASVFGWFGMEAVEAAIGDEVPVKVEENVEAAREAAEAVRVAPAGEISHV